MHHQQVRGTHYTVRRYNCYDEEENGRPEIEMRKQLQHAVMMFYTVSTKKLHRV